MGKQDTAKTAVNMGTMVRDVKATANRYAFMENVIYLAIARLTVKLVHLGPDVMHIVRKDVRTKYAMS
ncbi:hypothetical protein DPMN_132518 [Dreissena polymorpha]|uniref:Uncharacterized protein n=1 Tax=Dreissena polymorpha TaxID=45954 RepID=A0A9D4FWA8_DREPO|nr:hypothetical protein DPMN_132518 [Dreissena polymorpha]